MKAIVLTTDENGNLTHYLEVEYPEQPAHPETDESIANSIFAPPIQASVYPSAAVQWLAATAVELIRAGAITVGPDAVTAAAIAGAVAHASRASAAPAVNVTTLDPAPLAEAIRESSESSARTIAAAVKAPRMHESVVSYDEAGNITGIRDTS